MKTRFGSPSVIALALFMSSGCSIKSLAKQIEKEGDKQQDITCACLEGESADLCYDNDTWSFTDCHIDAMKEDSKASRETLNCILDGMKDITKCLEDEIDCDDPTSGSSCYAMFESLAVDCPDFPESVQEASQACDNGQN